MKKTFFYYLFPCFFLLLVGHTAFAQDLVWGLSGGSSRPTQNVYDETVIDMATDKNGNIYILSQVVTPDLIVAGQPVTGFGSNDVMLASFRPDRRLRWVKMIGNGEVDRCRWMGTDDKDGVYFIADLNQSNNPSHIDKDAVTLKNYQRHILVKYDTAGNYKWHRHPEADTLSTIATWSTNFTIAMDVSPSGDVYWLMQLYPGEYANGALKVTTTGTYLLKYSASGGFSYKKPDISVSGTIMNFISMKVDEANNQMYLSGYFSKFDSGDLLIDGNKLSECAFISCFKLDGFFLWEKHSAGPTEFYSRVAIDASGNIYLVGRGQATERFNGDTLTHGGGNQTPYVVKMDKSGKLLWAKDADVNNTGGAYAIALRNTDEVVIAGRYGDLLVWPDNPSDPS